MSVGEQLRRNSLRYADKPVIIDHGVEVPYRVFNERVNRLAHGLLRLGAGRGDRIAVYLDNCREALEVLAACLKLGLVHVPLNSRLLAPEVLELVTDAGATIVIADEGHAERLDRVREKLAGSARFLMIRDGAPGYDSYEQLLADGDTPEPDVQVTQDDGAYILYTSGTTGHAKGVYSTQRQVVSHALSVVIPEYQLHADSRILVLYPHNSAASVNNAVVPALILGATLVLDDVRGFTAERFLDNVERFGITHLTVVPTMLTRVLRHIEEHGLRHDIASLEVIAYGSAPMAPALTRRWLHIVGRKLMQVYGMTEATAVISILRRSEHDPDTELGSQRLSSCGCPVALLDVQIVDDDGRPVPDGEIGEIRFRSPFMMTSYWHDRERTAQTVRDGWLHTGDVGRRDRDGFLYVVDRKKDLIISGGQNIASKEVEDALYLHPGVAEAAVIGIPDDEWGEVVHAVVVVSEGVTERELIDFLTSRLASFKRPRSLEFRSELPKNAIGKIQKGELRAPFWADRQRQV
jgi:fatty-acyl-CoA synthase/long-chain acyl-CoA synthetase